MDIIAHAAWGATIIREQPQVWWAAFFGAFPDVWAAAPVFIYLRKYKWRRFYNKEVWAEAKENSAYVHVYYIVHSLFTASFITIIIALIWPDYWYVTIPYFIHILMDVGVHKGKWGTRLFYPFTDWHVEGLNWWETKWITPFNWGALIITNLIIWLTTK
jgi:hypothetical protein